MCCVIVVFNLTSFIADYLLTAKFLSKFVARQSSNNQSPFASILATWSGWQNRYLAWCSAHQCIQQFPSGTLFPMLFEQSTLAPLFTPSSNNVSPEIMCIPLIYPQTLLAGILELCSLSNRCPCFSYWSNKRHVFLKPHRPSMTNEIALLDTNETAFEFRQVNASGRQSAYISNLK